MPRIRQGSRAPRPPTRALHKHCASAPADRRCLHWRAVLSLPPPHASRAVALPINAHPLRCSLRIRSRQANPCIQPQLPPQPLTPPPPPFSFRARSVSRASATARTASSRPPPASATLPDPHPPWPLLHRRTCERDQASPSCSHAAASPRAHSPPPAPHAPSPPSPPARQPCTRILV